MSGYRIIPLGGGGLPSTTKYGAAIEMSLDSEYVLSLQLLDQDGNALGDSQSVDLPLESVVVGGTYDSATQSIILELDNGNTITIPVSGLVSGLQPEITAQNPLSADLLADGTNNKVYTAAEQTKLSGIATGAEVNVQADWNESDSSSDAYIQNKPTIPTVPTNVSAFTNDAGYITASDIPAQAQANWNESDTTAASYIQNKPTIPAAQVNADWNAVSGVSEILNKPTIPAAQVNSDWNASSGVAEILNKPNLATVATTGAYSDLSGTPTIADDLNDLTDVTISSPSNGQVLKYNSTSQKWENATGGGGGGSVVELTQAQYDALANPDPDTTYVITDSTAIDMGDYALKTEITELTAGKADKQNVTANTNELKFPTWNADGVITGQNSTTARAKTLCINEFTVYGILAPDSNSWPHMWIPITSGTAGQVLRSNGPTSNTAPSWVNIETLTGGIKFWLGTQAQYDALAPNYDSSTLYVVSD